MRPGSLLLATALLAGGGSAHAQVFFNMNFSAAAEPAAGWPTGAVPISASFTRTRIAGGGPNGEDAYELNQLHTGASVPFYGGEYYWGWNGNIEPQDPPHAARRYYRWRMRFSPTTNFRGIYLDGTDTTLTNKLVMVGDGCGRNRCRVILSYRGADNGTQAMFLRAALDGGEDPADTPPLDVGVWINVQVELQASSNASTPDGAYKIWINSNTYASPTAQRTGIQLNPVNWRYVFLGAYNNNGLQATGVHNIRLVGFQASTAFDAAWSAGGPPPTPTERPRPPQNLRVLP